MGMVHQALTSPATGPCTGATCGPVSPRFVLGYIITFAILLIICLQSPELQKTGASVSGTLNAFRVIFFLLTFFTIGMVSNFRKLMEEGIGSTFTWPSSMWSACSASSSGLGCSCSSAVLPRHDPSSGLLISHTA